jgi:hypothetical protein
MQRCCTFFKSYAAELNSDYQVPVGVRSFPSNLEPLKKYGISIKTQKPSARP